MFKQNYRHLSKASLHKQLFLHHRPVYLHHHLTIVRHNAYKNCCFMCMHYYCVVVNHTSSISVEHMETITTGMSTSQTELSTSSLPSSSSSSSLDHSEAYQNNFILLYNSIIHVLIAVNASSTIVESVTVFTQTVIPTHAVDNCKQINSCVLIVAAKSLNNCNLQPVEQVEFLQVLSESQPHKQVFLCCLHSRQCHHLCQLVS